MDGKEPDGTVALGTNSFNAGSSSSDSSQNQPKKNGASKSNGKSNGIRNMQISWGSLNFGSSMCHNLSSDHFDDKSLKN